MEQKQNMPRNPRRRTPFQRNRRLQGELLSVLLVAVVVFSLVMGSIMSNIPGSEDSYLEAFATAMGMVMPR